MNNYLKKQKLLKRIRNVSLFVTLAAVLVFIGIQPYIVEAFGSDTVFQYVIFILVALSLGILFFYESRYSKSEKYIEDAMLEINDAGYYYTARKESNPECFAEKVKSDLIASGYKLKENVTALELDFDFSAVKGSEYLYLVTLDNVDRNDVIAYIDSAIYDLTSVKMRSKGNGVIVFVCNNANAEAIALSKSVKRIISGKRVLKIGMAIAETESSKVYFRGNEAGVIQKLVAAFVMDCELPIDKKYIGEEKLPFQIELENNHKDFNLKDFKEGKYYER